MKNLFITLVTVMNLTGFAHAADPTGITQISEDPQLNNSACLRMLSSVECQGNAYAEPGNYHSNGSCQMKVAFQLSSGENVIHGVQSQASNDGYDGFSTAIGGAALGSLSLGLFDKMLASGASSGAADTALKNLKINLKKIAEDLELKGIAKCQDFKDYSSKVNSVTSSTAN